MQADADTYTSCVQGLVSRGDTWIYTARTSHCQSCYGRQWTLAESAILPGRFNNQSGYCDVMTAAEVQTLPQMPSDPTISDPNEISARARLYGIQHGYSAQSTSPAGPLLASSSYTPPPTGELFYKVHLLQIF